MKVYMVGGAVRDKILNRPVHDRDFVVFGTTPEIMLSQGYKKVGKHFPVFLHPETGEEYALARKEIKTGSGHKDFEFIFTPDITIKEDAIRRDFTCNALYEDINTGEIIDYHNGQSDIEARILRHISPHFVEDPLRVLRMCRFSAELDFMVAPETMALCQQMVQDGALKCLSKDRIWQEFEKALASENFYHFIENARECGALKILLPEVEELFRVPERTDFHPEGNSGAHTLLTLKAAQSSDSLINYAALLHDIGKIKTDPKCWPSHRGHDKLGVDVVKNIGKRLKIPTLYTEFAAFTAQHHMIYHQKIEENLREIADIAIQLSRFQHKDYCKRFIAVLKADMHGRGIKATGEEIELFKNFEDYMQQLVMAAKNKKPSELLGFENYIAGIKDGSLSPSILNDAYITALLEENPYISRQKHSE